MPGEHLLPASLCAWHTCTLHTHRPHLTFNERGASLNRYGKKACRSTIYFSAYNEQAWHCERKECLAGCARSSRCGCHESCLVYANQCCSKSQCGIVDGLIYCRNTADSYSFLAYAYMVHGVVQWKLTISCGQVNMEQISGLIIRGPYRRATL